MAERIAYLEAVVGADITQFRKGMRDIRNDVGILSETIGGISGAARTMTFAFTTPVVALGTYAVQAAATFDASMRNINSIAQLPEAAFQALSQQVLDFGKTTRDGAEGAATALYEVYSAGIAGKDAFDIMTIGTKTAEAGLANVAETVKGLTAAGLTFGDTSAKAMQRYADATTVAVQLGVGSMNTFNTGISNVIGTGSLLGVTFEDLSATIAFMSQRGVDFSSAGTYMNQALAKMMKPSEELSKVFTELHVKSGKELISTFGGIEGALRAIYGQVGDNEAVWGKLFGDVRAFKAVAPFVKAFKEDGNDAVNSFFANFNDKMSKGGATQAAWEQQTMSFSAVVDHFTAALQAVAIVIGQKIIPIVTPLIEGFTKTLLAITEINPEIITMGIAFVGAVAAAAPLVWMLTSMLNPIGLVIGGITMLGTAFATNFNGARDTVAKVVRDILGDVQPLIDTFNDFWSKVFPPPPTASDIMGDTKIPVNADDIITIEKPMSLWDLYTSKGYDKYFSWNEFMKKAREGGWDGKGLDIGDKIKLPNQTAMDNAKKGLDGVATGVSGLGTATRRMEDEMNRQSEKPMTFFERLASAASEAWPKIKPELDQLWTNIKGWVDGTLLPAMDTAGGRVLDKIIGWFNPTSRNGDTEAFNGIKSIFDGGASRGVTEGVNILQGKFPQITAGIKGLLNNVGAWIETEGVPTIARSLGYFIGSVGATMGQLLGSLGSNIVSGEAATAAGGLADGINKSIITPATEGFNQSMKDKGIKSSIDGFFTLLAGALVTAAGVSVFGGMLAGQGFAGAVFGTIGTALSTAKTAITVGADILGKIANNLMNTSIGATLANGASNFAGRIVSTITDKIDYQIKLPMMFKFDAITDKVGTALSTAFTTTTTWATGVGSAIWGVIAPAIGVAMGAAGLVLGTILIAGTAGILFSPSFREKFSTALRGVISGAVDSLFGEGTWDKAMNNFEQGGYKVAAAFFKATGDKTKADAIEKMFTPNPERIGLITSENLEKAAKEPFYFTPEIIAANPQIDFTGKPEVVMEQLNVKWDELVKNGQMSVENEGEMMRYLQKIMSDPDLKTNFGKGYDMYLEMLNVKMPDKTDTPKTSDGSVYDPLTGMGITPDSVKKKGDEVNTEIKTSIDTWGATVLANIGDGGSMDANRIITSFLQPLEDHWNTMFAPSGAMTTNFQGLVKSFSGGLASMMLGMAGWSVAAIVSNALVNNSFNVYTGIKNKLVDVNTEAKKLSDTLNGLVTHSPYNIVINITTNGSTPTVPSGNGDNGTGGKTSAVGTYNVPYNNYVATLHESEMVLDKQEAHDYRNMPAIMAGLVRNMRGGGGGGTMTKQDVVVNVYGAQDADGLLRELDRRGYKLEKR